ncbi:3-hydroxyisobutyrate dehydrogenase [Agrococcus jenensis]|uniref:3-hydroxyisobutyrate dehydrogenase n=2 Tax=Agrococcus jenensis TaxID=46353 RepID=A0A3N2APZ7_9MICO|nr:NAD(P)-dependent oxidoreductase [Agrococcus jenensis]ROR64988.1 3-hydroxyisobutyrate dehydrogenase [Agrococcus jenensis]
MSVTLFLGLGRMGAPMARLHAAAFETRVYDVFAEAAKAVADASDAVAVSDLASQGADADVVILMLPTSRHVEEALQGDGLFARLPKGALVIDMGSSEPASTRALAAFAAGLGLEYVDAPVSGGIAKAETGELTIMVGGEDDAVARAMPHLETVGTSIVHVGPAGAGHAAKALNNLVSATNIAAATEAVTVAKHFGIEPATMVEVLNASTGMSQATQVKFPQHILPGTYASRFAYDLMLKDMGIAVQMAGEVGFAPVTGAAFTTLAEGRAGLGEHPDHTEIARVYARATGISIDEGQPL